MLLGSGKRLFTSGPAGPAGATLAAALSDVAAGMKAVLTAPDLPTARSNFGLALGANVQAWSANLDALSGTASATFGRSLLAAATAGDARTTLGLGTLAVQNASGVAISGGNINGTAIGGTAPSAAVFTSVAINNPLPVGSGGTGAATLSAGLDAAFGSTRGNLLYRGSTGWMSLGPGAVGQYLGTGGAGADPSWGTPSGAGNVSTSGSPTAGQFAVFASSTSIKGVGAASFRNRIINGNFAINQRGVSGTVALAAGAYGHDRFKAGAGGCTYTFSTAANGDTTLNISAGTLLQVIEGGLYLPEGGQYVLSWTGTATARVYQGAASGSYSASPLATGPAAGTNTTVEFSTGTLGLVQFEPGSAATPYERRDDEMCRCQRYYGVYTGRLQSVAVSASNQYAPLHIGFGAQMRPGTLGISVATSAAAGAATSYVSVASDQYGADLALGFSALNTLSSATATLIASNEL